MSKNQVTFKSNIQTHISVITPEGETRSQGQGSLIGMVFAVAALVGIAIARPDSPPTYGYSAPTPSYAPAKYDFNYAVNDQPSGNDFGHEEARDGDNTQGSYYVLLPDGRLQRVTYNVNGDSGYVADVTYEGEARYPTPKASYGPPQPSLQASHSLLCLKTALRIFIELGSLLIL
ncbi:cuticle protein 19-like [Penaeus monodon]|uniref:cuticle protein 19-like n=1 Tax=Penaeus monodon TaxID=6687 RepID=UPI0018A6E236|nr:cuticle protein 19-like [Penaeus monodon]